MPTIHPVEAEGEQTVRTITPAPPAGGFWQPYDAISSPAGLSWSSVRDDVSVCRLHVRVEGKRNMTLHRAGDAISGGRRGPSGKWGTAPECVDGGCGQAEEGRRPALNRGWVPQAHNSTERYGGSASKSELGWDIECGAFVYKPDGGRPSSETARHFWTNLVNFEHGAH